MDIGFDQIKDMTIGEVLKLKQDHSRLEKENALLKRKYPTRAKELNKEDFNLNKFLEDC